MIIGRCIDRRMRAALAVCFGSPILASCSTVHTSNITGRIETRGPHVVGTKMTSNGAFHAGDIALTLSHGVKCEGAWTERKAPTRVLGMAIAPREGEGALKCSSSESGRFEFKSTDFSGNGEDGEGTGVIGGRPFTFSFQKQH